MLEKLTNAQKSIWVTEQYYKGSSVNNICGTAIIDEKVDFEKLEKSIKIVCQKHDNFKLKLRIRDGEAKQELSEMKNCKIDIFNVANLKELEKKRKEIVKIPFILENSLLFKFYIFKFTNGQGAFMLNIHHLIADAWTLAFICNEIIKTYSALKQNQEIETKAIYSYMDYINSEKEYLKSEKYQTDKKYWIEKFQTIPEVATIPGSKNKNIDLTDVKGERTQFSIKNEEVNKIKNYCKENKISLYNFFMAIFAIYIAEITNLDDFVIGTPILNRTNYKEKNAAGMFINMAPLRISFKENIDFKEFVKSIAIDSINMLKHQKYSYQSLLEELRNKNSNTPNLYNILLSYQITNAQMSGGDIKYKTDWTFNECCADDLDIQIYDINDTGNLNIAYDYKKSIYTRKDIENLHNRILYIIKQIITFDNVKIQDIDIVTPIEKEKIVKEFNQTEVKYDINKTISKLFEEQVKNNPNKVALISNENKITYQELNQKANLLAKYLIAKGVKKSNIVGIMVNRSPEMIIGLIAILKCGATYLPIDPEYPLDRISYMIENSETKTVLVNNNTEKLIPQGCSKINIELKNKDIFTSKDIENININIKPDTLAYLIYTSGSTGKPKGVKITHRNLNNFIVGMKNIIDFDSKKVMLSVTTICFDIFGLEIWCSLLSGQTLVLANEEEQNNPVLLNQLCIKNKVNIIQTTPSRYSVIFEKESNLDFLRYISDILVGGESLNKKLLKNMKKYSKARIFNVYGPTETTIWSTVKELTKEKDITIGKPIANTQCYILNKNYKLLPTNIEGELYIGGDGVSSGYLKRDDLTAEKFIKLPFKSSEKIYNTNDLAYYNNNGELVLLGRTDHQVKIRGFRVELGEIENIIEREEEINKCVVIKKKLSNGHEILVAYYTANKKGDTDYLENKLKEELKKELPQYMVPQFIIRIDKMPHTPNGKVDRKLLPEPYIKNEKKEITKPRNEIDKKLIKMLNRMLSIDNISINDSLLELGGDSLTAITLSTKILSKFNVQIGIKDILNKYTIKDISDYISDNESEDSLKIKIEKAPIQELYPLSTAQKRIYYNCKIIGEKNIVYNLPGAILVDDILYQEKVQEIFEKIIERHEILRTSFIIKNDDIFQKVEDKIKFKIPVYNNRNEEIKEIINNFSKPFELEKAPLIRAELHYIDKKKTLLLLESHHIVMDGTGLNNLIIEFNRLYNGENLKKIPIQYKDYAVWENEFNKSKNIEKYEQYWVNKFKDSEFMQLNLPYDYKIQSTRSYNGNKISKIIDEDYFRKIERYAKKIGVSPYMFFITVFFVLLYKYTGQKDITLGSPIANRNINETKRMIGMFGNNIVIRGKINPDATFNDFLNEIKNQILDDLSNQPYPFDMLVKKLNIKNSGSRNPLFDIMFTYQNKEENIVKIGEEHCQVIEINNNISKFNLSIEIKPEIHTINIEYNTNLFCEETVQKLFEHYTNTIQYIIENIQTKIKDIQIISKYEKNKILFEFNDNHMNYPKDKTIIELFEEQVNKNGKAIAIEQGEKRITYEKLNKKANYLANRLIELGVKEGEVIGINLNRSIELIISIIATLKIGAIYMPMYVGYPEERLEYMLKNSNSKILICKETNKFNNIKKYILNYENLKEEIQLNTNKQFKPEKIAYVIYTSGSTGKPKGVLIQDKNLINFVNAFKKYYNENIGEKDKFLASTNISFDVSIWEIFLPLLNGSTLVLYKEEIIQNIIEYSETIIKKEITGLYIPPNILEELYSLIKNSNAKINKILVGVEPIKKEVLNKYLNLNKDLIIINGYGPTETTICCTALNYKKSSQEGIVPIGRPLKNDNIYILNIDNNIQPIGIPGEIYVTGDGVGKGYINNPNETSKNFLLNKMDKSSTLMYRTGDIAKWNEDGTISFIGRNDTQVKISGHRIELNEINHTLMEYPEIIKSHTIIREIKKRKYIVSYYIARKKISSNELRKYLQNKLTDYMIPYEIIQLEKFPLTANGKIDNKMLPFNYLKNTTNNKPRNLTEEKLVKLYKKLFAMKNIGIDDNFFELGGDSVLAMRLQIEASKDNINVTYADIFKYPTIRQLAKEVKRKIEDDIIKRNPIASYYPMSSAQKRIYIASNMDNNSTLYNITGGILIEEKPNLKRLQEAVNEIIEKNDILRTYFEVNEDGEFIQKICEKTDNKIQLVKIENNDIDNIFNEYQTRFDLSKAPLFKIFLFSLPNRKSLLMLDIHHIIFDGTSQKLFLKKIIDLYNGRKIDNSSISYKDFSLWENKQLKADRFKESKEFWLNKFNKDISILNMPTTYPRPLKKGYKGNLYKKKITKELTKKIYDIAKNKNVTPYMIMLSAYYILLYKYTGQEDIIVGSPVSGRIYKEIENALGMFVNSVPLRQEISGEDSFEQFLYNVKDNTINCFSHQDYPFDKLVKDLKIPKDSSRNDIFDVMFNYQNQIYLNNISFDGNLAQIYIPKTNTSKFDITLEIIPNEDIMELSIEYCTELFDEQYIKKFTNHYYNILKCIVENLQIKIKDIEILEDNEKNKLLYEFNDTYISYDKNKTVSQLFEEQVEKNSNKVAVVFEEEKITYKELNEKSNQLANYIRNKEIKANDIIGIMLPRSIELISTIMGVKKSGACYIPIDPTYPEKRIKYMLENSKAKLLLTNDKLYNSVNYKNKISVEYSNDEIYKQNNSNLKNINNNDDLAYVIYTSGSTGNPKGVKITNKNLYNFVIGMKNRIDFNENKTMVSVTTISFDIFGLEIWESLTSGLTLVVANENEQNIPALLNQLCLKNKVNMIQTTPSRYSLMFEDKENLQFIANMTDILVGGEPFEEKILKKFKELTSAKIYNMYGPTETTIWSTVKDLTNYEEITIGKPIANTQVYVLDKNLSLVPVGVIGELYIAGDGVGKGYLNRDDLTKERFIQNPFLKGNIMYKTGDLCKFNESGELYCLGRIDNQVKIRGIRIELDEIEKKIAEFPNIKQAKVVKQKLTNREIISAYYIANKRIRITELRTYLYKWLPDYMVPSYFTALDAFPYTPNGKIDKKALPIPNEILKSNEKTYVAPKSNLELKLVNIWEKILNTKPIGILDNFFELGGDSMLAMNLNIKLLKITNKIHYSDIFAYPTIAELAEKIEKEIKNNEKTMNLTYLNTLYKDILEQNMEIPNEINYHAVGNVLLTGVTGFLGIHILEELIKQENGKIYVLIRREPGINVKEKLLNKMHYYFESKYDKYIDDRIIIIEGQIMEDGFGLDQEEVFKLGNSVDCIINSAAKVSHYGNYLEFYNINVKSVEKIIDFANAFNLKLFHVSTLSVSGNTFADQFYEETNLNKEILFDEKNFYVGQSLENVYVRSKFEAEKRILDAIYKGTNAYILRMGNLMPRILDGKFQDNITDNAYLNRLKEIIEIGCIPQYLKEIYLEFTPVDSSAQAILKIMQFTNNKNRIYHIFNDDHIFIEKILKILKTENIKFEIINNEQFKQKIKDMLNSDNSNHISTLVNDLDKNLNLQYHSKIRLDSKHSVKLLKMYGFKWQKIDEKYIKNILKLIKGEIENDNK